MAARDCLGQYAFDDAFEIEVDVVAGDVELDGGDLAGLGVCVDDVDQFAELLRGESTHGDDAIQLMCPGEIIPEVGRQADVGPAEGVQPAGIDSYQRLCVQPQQLQEFVRPPV